MMDADDDNMKKALQPEEEHRARSQGIEYRRDRSTSSFGRYDFVWSRLDWKGELTQNDSTEQKHPEVGSASHEEDGSIPDDEASKDQVASVVQVSSTTGEETRNDC